MHLNIIGYCKLSKKKNLDRKNVSIIKKILLLKKIIIGKYRMLQQKIFFIVCNNHWTKLTSQH